MASVSHLAKLYEATYGEPPSSQTTAALLRMEEMLGLTQDDPLARMLIVQLRVADQVAKTLSDRTAEEREFTSEIKGLIGKLNGLLTNIDEARSLEAGRLVRAGSDAYAPSAPVLLDAYRKTSPLFTYLVGAFQSLTSVEEQNERVVGARSDLAMLIFCAVVVVVFAFTSGIVFSTYI